jgi:hypothetical protein
MDVIHWPAGTSFRRAASVSWISRIEAVFSSGV